MTQYAGDIGILKGDVPCGKVVVTQFRGLWTTLGACPQTGVLTDVRLHPNRGARADMAAAPRSAITDQRLMLMLA